jgi:hypothetical protein
MSELPFKFDEIGIWSELKLEIIEQYGAAYTKAFARTPNLKNTTSTLSVAPACMSPRKRERKSRGARPVL